MPSHFWRLLIASFIFWFLMKLKRQRFPKSRKATMYAVLSGIFLAFDLSFWHESVYAVGPGISTFLNSLQIFFLAAIGLFFFGERQTKLQILSLFLAVIGVVLISGEELQHNFEACTALSLGSFLLACLQPQWL